MPAARPPALSAGVVAPAGEVRAGRGSRVARGAAAAVLSTAVALGSHLLAGAEAPGVLGVVVPLVFAVSVCTVLAGVRLSAVRLSVSVVTSQVLFHLLFVLGTVPAGTSAVTGAGHDAHLGHGGHVAHSGHAVHESMTLASVTGTAVTGTTGGAGHAAHASVGMWLAHAGAAVLTVLALHRGETLLRQLRRLATAVLTWVLPRRSAPCLLVLRRRRGPLDARPVVARSLEVLAGCVPRRGPPELPST